MTTNPGPTPVVHPSPTAARPHALPEAGEQPPSRAAAGLPSITQTVMGSVNLLDEMIARGIYKPTCGADDGSNEGPWLQRLAAAIDGTDQRVQRASGVA